MRAANAQTAEPARMNSLARDFRDRKHKARKQIKA